MIIYTYPYIPHPPLCYVTLEWLLTRQIVCMCRVSTYVLFIKPDYLCDRNGLYGSAVCAFSQAQIESAFNGNFKDQADWRSNWLKVPDSNVPTPRPGSVRRLPWSHQLSDNKVTSSIIAFTKHVLYLLCCYIICFIMYGTIQVLLNAFFLEI